MNVIYVFFQSQNKFQDGVRIVDFVLAYESIDNEHHQEKRRIYEKNLISRGLELEREETQKLHFVKIHVPKTVLSQYCEILKMRMPIKDVSSVVYFNRLIN